jgi:hypothetical protein
VLLYGILVYNIYKLTFKRDAFIESNLLRENSLPVNQYSVILKGICGDMIKGKVMPYLFKQETVHISDFLLI